MQLGRRSTPSIPVHIWTDADSIPEFVPLDHAQQRSFSQVDLEAVLAGTTMPGTVVSRRSRGLRAMKLEELGWKMVKNEVSVVRGDVDSENLKLAAVYALELFVMLRSFLGGPDPGKALISIRLFKEESQYRHAARIQGAPYAEAYYNPVNTEIVMSFGQYANEELFQRSFAHEFTHAYVDRIFKKLEPIWLMEGIAEWFSNLEWRGDILVPGRMNRYSLQMLRMEPIPLSIKRLTTLLREEIYGYYFQQYYAQAWSLVDYLMTQLPYRAIERILGGERFDFEAHQEAWEAHVQMMLSAAEF